MSCPPCIRLASFKISMMKNRGNVTIVESSPFKNYVFVRNFFGKPVPLNSARTNEIPSSNKRPFLSGISATMTSEGALIKEYTRRIGGLQTLPMVQPAYELLGTALKKARHVKPTKGITNIAKRERNRGAKQLDALTKELTMPLGLYVKNFPTPKKLHPFESSVLELTLGPGVYEQTLQHVDSLRKKLLNVGKSLAASMSEASTKAEAEEKLRVGYAKIEEYYNKNSHVVDDLKEMTKVLRSLPLIDPVVPTVCLVGAPNVGKSSIVRQLSTGKPEICNYPFTTRGIIMGHIYVDFAKFQVTDTPGLLWRTADKRNRMERLTLSALEHLSSALVIFVHDLTGDCGTAPEDQFKLHEELRSVFPSLPWVDVLSKGDLLPDLVSNSSTNTTYGSSLEQYLAFGPKETIKVSTVTGEGIEQLKKKVESSLLSLETQRPENFLQMQEE